MKQYLSVFALCGLLLACMVSCTSNNGNGRDELCGLSNCEADPQPTPTPTPTPTP